MATSASSWNLGELAHLLEGELHGPADLRIERPVPAGSRDPAGIAFAETPSYLREAEEAGVGALLLPPDLSSQIPFIRVKHPRAAFGKLLALCRRPLPFEPGIHSTAVVHSDAIIHSSASVGPYAVIERGARVGENVRIYAFCYVGENCALGPGSVLYPHVVLYQDVTLEAGVIVHSGTVLGADGFGYQWNGAERVKVPHIGSVHLQQDVEIGALSAVDRATMGKTQIGRGTKIDNLVQVAHNVTIGENCIVAGLSGISGSTTLGDRVVMGGQCATSHHITVGSDISMGGRTGVLQDITEPGEYFGMPARPMADAMRAVLIATKLPEFVARLRKLEKLVHKK